MDPVIKTNSSLGATINKIQERCLKLESKIEKLRRYERLVKNCQRLQCNTCNRLFTPLHFFQHGSACLRQSTKSLHQFKDTSCAPFETAAEHSTLQQVIEEDQLGHPGLLPDRNFLAKIVNISLGDEHSVAYNFCILYQGKIYYKELQLAEILSSMKAVGDRADADEIERCLEEKEEEPRQIELFQKISEIVEIWVAQLHKQILDSRFSLVGSRGDDEQAPDFVMQFRNMFDIALKAAQESEIDDSEEEQGETGGAGGRRPER